MEKLFLAVLLLVPSQAAFALEEADLLFEIRQLALNAEGAVDSVVNRMACQSWERLFMKNLKVPSAVISSLNEEPAYSKEPNAPWDFHGGNGGGPSYGAFYALAGSCLEDRDQPLIRLGEWARLDTELKTHQDFQVDYYVAIPFRLLETLRKGQKVSFDLEIWGIQAIENRGQKFITVKGLANDVSTEVKPLKCANGHEYAPTSGYQFCPIDGKPLSSG